MAYDKKTDYQYLMDKYASAGDLTSAAQYEQKRNEKIAGEGLNYQQTNQYSNYLPISANQYQSKYTDQIKQAADDVAGIKDFSYDPDTDKNYQAMSNAYNRQANNSMRDTVGTIAGQTGGLASSYAASAGAQSAQNYMAQLNDKVPDLYNLALSSWQANNSAKTNKLSTLQGLDNDAYSKFANDRSYLAGRNDTMYNRDYTEKRDEKSDAAAQREFEFNAEQQKFTNAMAKWAASGSRGLDAASAAILGIPAGTLYSDYEQFVKQLEESRYEAQLRAN